MVNNFELICKLVEQFHLKDTVFDLIIIQRKKDNIENKSGRVIYRKLIESGIDLLSKESLIKTLCEYHRARAYINLNPKSKELITKRLSVKAAEDVAFFHNYDPEELLGAAIGSVKGTTEFKIWVVDIDYNPKPDAQSTNEILVAKTREAINACMPTGPKIWATLPTRHGIHLLTAPFNLAEFEKYKLDVEVKKDNPTLLYYPDSLP